MRKASAFVKRKARLLFVEGGGLSWRVWTWRKRKIANKFAEIASKRAVIASFLIIIANIWPTIANKGRSIANRSLGIRACQGRKRLKDLD